MPSFVPRVVLKRCSILWYFLPLKTHIWKHQITFAWKRRMCFSEMIREEELLSGAWAWDTSLVRKIDEYRKWKSTRDADKFGQERGWEGANTMREWVFSAVDSAAVTGLAQNRRGKRVLIGACGCNSQNSACSPSCKPWTVAPISLLLPGSSCPQDVPWEVVVVMEGLVVVRCSGEEKTEAGHGVRFTWH